MRAKFVLIILGIFIVNALLPNNASAMPTKEDDNEIDLGEMPPEFSSDEIKSLSENNEGDDDDDEVKDKVEDDKAKESEEVLDDEIDEKIDEEIEDEEEKRDDEIDEKRDDEVTESEEAEEENVEEVSNESGDNDDDDETSDEVEDKVRFHSGDGKFDTEVIGIPDQDEDQKEKKTSGWYENVRKYFEGLKNKFKNKFL